MVSQRKKRSRQETLEASSFTVVAAIKEKAAADEGEEGVNGDAKALLDTTATVPFKFKQVKLADFYITSTKAAAAKEDAHREKVKAARKGKKKSKDPATSSKVVAEARWLDKSERQDGQLNKEGKVNMLKRFLSCCNFLIYVIKLHIVCYIITVIQLHM